MAIQDLYQLPNKLLELRLGAKKSQSGFAESVGIDQSHWCALEKGRRHFGTPRAVLELLDRVGVDQADRQAFIAAFEHDRVLAQLGRSAFPPEAASLVSRCLEDSLALDQEEIRGLISTVSSVLASKQELAALARRASKREEARMD